MTTNIPNSATTYPFDSIVSIGDTIGGVAHRATGVLIFADEVLTSADAVWSAGIGTATNITATRALNDGSQPFGQFTVDAFHYVSINNGPGETVLDQQADFALLHLSKQDIGPTESVDASFSGGAVHITGYPDSAGGGSMIDTSETLIADGQGATFQQSAPIGSGMSGAPAWILNSPPVGARVVGVVSATDRVADITVPVAKLIDQWMRADHPNGLPTTLSGAVGVEIPLVAPIVSDAGAPGVDPREAALVDKLSYLINRPDVAAAGVDPALHFATEGWHEGTSPDPLFDTKYYLQHNPDVAAAGIDPLLHYAEFGWREGRDPSAAFSTRGYLAANPDINLLGIDPLEHYLTFGVAEGRPLLPTNLDVTAKPFNTVVQVKTVSASGVAMTGAGVLIAPDEVLTAADLVWQQGTGIASSVAVDPQRNGSASLGTLQPDHFRFFTVGAPSQLNSQSDFALLHLAAPVPGIDATQIMPMVASLTAFGNSQQNSHITGYPVSRGGDTMNDLSVTPVADHFSMTAHFSNQPWGIEPGYTGAPLWAAVGRLGFFGTNEIIGVETPGGFAAALGQSTIQTLNSWMALDHSGAAQPSGGIAVAPPPLLRIIDSDKGAPGVDPREAVLVDKFSYLANRPDVAAAGIDPALHFATVGWREGTKPDPLFDPTYYLQHNPDVAAAGIDPLLHYATVGWHEGRDPSADFSTSFYLAANLGVAGSGIDPLEHYLTLGVASGFKIAPGAP